MTVITFLTGALSEIRAVRAGDVVAPEDLDQALFIFNELLDALNADGRAIYARMFAAFTLTPNLQPHTIGLSTNSPAPTFAVTVGRPKAILNGNIILTNNIRSPLTWLDDDEWNEIVAGAAAGQTPTITASIPRYGSYSPAWPNGEIKLWPVPKTAYPLEIETDTLLAQVTLATTFSLPFGYQQALRLTTAELCAPSFGQTVSAGTAKAAREARARIWGDNIVIPTISTRDAGMPGIRGGLWNYMTGQVGR